MMKRYLLIVSMLFCALFAGAQSNIVQELEREVSSEGRVVVNQPEKLSSLMGSMISSNGKPSRVEGYRVMVYSGNNSAQARNEANNMAKFMRENFPGAEVYVVFESPIRSCLYGDYRTREEAEAVMYKLKGTKKFREISVKKCIINLPY
ncbi:MAG: SPOR domain-containing protein [Bacteroidaceae bacterium]|nr:SPOR domain-containing protein [Bacteroidaceae bacterium]